MARLFFASAFLLLALLPLICATPPPMHRVCECLDYGNFCNQWKCRTEAERRDGDLCFSGDQTTLLESGIERRMDQLRIGDRVLTTSFDKSSQAWVPSFSPVYAFLHRVPEAETADYLRVISEEPGKSLTLSPSHLVMCVRGGASSGGVPAAPGFDQADACLARSLSRGDWVFKGDSLRQPEALLVRALERDVSAVGAYAPATLDGKIVVSGIVASVYAELPSQTLVHALFAPLRWWHTMFGSVSQDSNNGGRIHPYAQFLRSASSSYLPAVVRALDSTSS